MTRRQQCAINQKMHHPGYRCAGPHQVSTQARSVSIPSCSPPSKHFFPLGFHLFLRQRCLCFLNRASLLRLILCHSCRCPLLVTMEISFRLSAISSPFRHLVKNPTHFVEFGVGQTEKPHVAEPDPNDNSMTIYRKICDMLGRAVNSIIYQNEASSCFCQCDAHRQRGKRGHVARQVSLAVLHAC